MAGERGLGGAGGEELWKRDICGRERPCPLSLVRGLCYLFVQNTFNLVHQKSWNCYHMQGFFLITFHCLCENTQVLSTAVP